MDFSPFGTIYRAVGVTKELPPKVLSILVDFALFFNGIRIRAEASGFRADLPLAAHIPLKKGRMPRAAFWWDTRAMNKPTLALLLILTSFLCPLTAQASSPQPVPATAPGLAAPQELAPFGSGWSLRGSGALRFLGFKAYDANLWQLSRDGDFSYARPFALEIRYDMNIKGSDIANTSLIELSRITPTPAEQLTRWGALMGSIFVDVKPGDRLVGLHLPGRGVRFFLNGRLQGESPDVAFSEAFFKIWLDPATKRPDLRARLLGQVATPPTPAAQ